MDDTDSTFEALLVAGRWDAAARYRCSHVREQLELVGIRAEVASLLDADLRDGVRERPVVIFHRVGLDRFVEGLCRRVREDGGLVVYDTDDLVFDAEARLAVRHGMYGVDPVRAAWVREDARAQREAMEQADAVLVATDYLAGEVRELCRRVWVHRNGFSLEMLRLSEEARRCQRRAERQAGAGPSHGDGLAGQSRQVVIGYASGTPTHDDDFLVARPALEHILRTHEHAELWLVGPVDPGGGWGSVRDRVRRSRLVPWRDLPGVLVRFDISIAPVDSGKRACRGKSEVKYIETGLVGVPIVASVGAGFDQAIRSGENGLLASSAEDWVEHLELLIGGPERGRRMGERAYADVLERYHPATRGSELLHTLNEVSLAVRGRPLWPEAARGRPMHGGSQRPGPSGSPTPSRGRPEMGRAGAVLVRRGLYSLRYRGVRMFLMELWIYTRGWLRGLLRV